MGKSSQHDKSRHEMAVRHCVNDILNGGTWSVMAKKLQEDEYELGYCYSRCQTDRIIQEARKRIKDDTDEMMKSLKEDMIARTLDVYSEARELGDRFSALKALEQLNKMFGFYENKLKVEGNVNSNVTINFGFNDDSE